MQTKTNAIALTFILGFGGLIAIIYAALAPFNSRSVYAYPSSSSATNTELVYPVYLTATLLIEELPDGTQIELIPSPTYHIFDAMFILPEDEHFTMWVSNRNITVGGQTSVEQYLESQDGLVWTNRTNTNLIDNTPDYHFLGAIRQVIYDQGIYEGWESKYHNVVNGMWVRTIRYITSTNGIDWQIVTPSIIASAGPPFNLAKSDGLYEMWTHPYGDSNYTGTRSLRYRTSATPNSDWGHWQTGGTLVLIDGAEVQPMTYLRKLPDGTYQLFYVTGSYVHSAISNDGINFTATGTNLFNFEEILPDYGVHRSFVVVDVNGEDWFYFNYRDTSGQGKLAVVRPEWPVSELSADNDSPTPLGGITHLTATLSTGSNVTYTWDLGDGAAATGANVAHTYPAVGVYTAVVTASNSSSALSATTVVTIT
ncbi:MAG: PKD domain-containing protein, partial [Anaerolinea sp.]|nr:PKD domain-containing protein [Anaerolinea sp.]